MDDDFPPYVRDSSTSYAAAASVDTRTASIRAAVFRAIYDARGLTCDEAEALLNLRHQTCSARVWELHHKMGLIVDSNLRRRTRSDRWAVVWVDKATLEDPMRYFITGCSVAVPVSENPAEGFVRPDEARQACTEMAGELPRLLIAQTHDQAKAACAGCPKCGPIAPHLAAGVTVVRKQVDGSEAQLAPQPVLTATAVEELATVYEPAPEPELAMAAAQPAPAPATPPSTPPSDQPAWLQEMLRAAGAAPPAVPTPDPSPLVNAEPEPEPEPPPATAEPPLPEPVSAPASAPPDASAMFDAAMVHSSERPPMLSLLPPEVNTGPSVMGSSTLRAFQLCMRAGFYRIMKGIRRRRQTERIDDRGVPKFDPLDLGTLVHQVLARFYEGDENPFAFLSAIAPHYPNIVEETRRLCTLHFNAYAERDRKIFDIRFVELESRYYFKKKRVKSAKKNLSLCLSSKHDLGFRKKGTDEPRLPPGVAASGITIMDHKTIGAMTQDAQTAYRHDPQIFTNAVTYERGNSVEPGGQLGAPSAARFGPLTHFAINLIGKAQIHDPTKHLVRLTQIIPRDLLDSYVDDIQHWLYTELADRMFHPAAWDDVTWPKSYLCRDPSTGRPCPYVELCERGGLKRVDPSINFMIDKPYNPELLIKPEAPKKGRKPRAKAAAEVERK